MADYSLQKIHPINIDIAWPLVSGKIQEALNFDGDFYSLEQIYSGIINRELDLWIIFKKSNIFSSVFVTSVTNNNTFGILFGAGDNMSEWVHLIDELIEYGKSKGCSMCEVHGRVGWERVLKPYGFKRKKIVLTKKL